MRSAELEECVSVHTSYVRKMMSIGLFSNAYSPWNDVSLIRTRSSLVGAYTYSFRDGRTYDLTDLSDQDKRLIAALGLKNSTHSGYECLWCGNHADRVLTDSEVSVAGCCVDCCIKQILYATGLFKTKASLKKYMTGGISRAKKPRRPRV
jgi:hypothetical protein